ncbi:hypothetical protein NE237_009577 [Protea cynaroides]|uniref:Uncharacterized protein n=1 Tax=Protea cynaroides TaxID=273540 RepID=A0A9Q0KY08_9MAGN|nr:hypothetical protein NE237_009577 [Protea cynaroides]
MDLKLALFATQLFHKAYIGTPHGAARRTDEKPYREHKRKNPVVFCDVEDQEVDLNDHGDDIDGISRRSSTLVKQTTARMTANIKRMLDVLSKKRALHSSDMLPYEKVNYEKPGVKLVFWEGTTKILTGDRVAGEIMFEYPERMVCHAGSFYIGQPIPALAIGDELITGETYFVLPIERFACKMFSASSLVAFASSPKPAPINFRNCPLQYIKGESGRVSIRVSPEFILKILLGSGEEKGCSSPANSSLCSTPELQKHYVRLVGSKDQTWSPRLDTISEFKRTTTTWSPVRLFRLEKKPEDLEE